MLTLSRSVNSAGPHTACHFLIPDRARCKRSTIVIYKNIIIFQPPLPIPIEFVEVEVSVQSLHEVVCSRQGQTEDWVIHGNILYHNSLASVNCVNNFREQGCEKYCDTRGYCVRVCEVLLIYSLKCEEILCDSSYLI